MSYCTHPIRQRRGRTVRRFSRNHSSQFRFHGLWRCHWRRRAVCGWCFFFVSVEMVHCKYTLDLGVQTKPTTEHRFDLTVLATTNPCGREKTNHTHSIQSGHVKPTNRSKPKGSVYVFRLCVGATFSTFRRGTLFTGRCAVAMGFALQIALYTLRFR